MPRGTFKETRGLILLLLCKIDLAQNLNYDSLELSLCMSVLALLKRVQLLPEPQRMLSVFYLFKTFVKNRIKIYLFKDIIDYIKFYFTYPCLIQFEYCLTVLFFTASVFVSLCSFTPYVILKGQCLFCPFHVTRKIFHHGGVIREP